MDQRWWWNLQQKKLTGLASFNYKEIAEGQGIESQFCSTRESNGRQEKSIFRAFGGYIVDVKIGKSAKGEYARLTIEHNYKLFKVMVWSNEFENFKDQIKGAEKNLIVFDGELKYDSKWSKSNQFTIKESSRLIVL